MSTKTKKKEKKEIYIESADCWKRYLGDVYLHLLRGPSLNLVF